MYVAGSIIHVVLFVFIALMWVRFIVDWVMVFARQWQPTGPLLVVLEVVYSITDPPIKALRKVIPPRRLGPVSPTSPTRDAIVRPTSAMVDQTTAADDNEWVRSCR